MPRPFALASRLIPGLCVVGLAALAAITLGSPGATRMYAWPWSIAYALTLIAPTAILALRVWASGRSLTIPRRSWLGLALAGASLVIVSALASPYRGPSLLWSAPLLAALAVFLLVFDWLHADPAQADARRIALLKFAGLGFALIAVVSMGLWAADLPRHAAGEVFDARNPYPLGHSNYTAGLALLMLPCFVALAVRASGRVRIAWFFAVLLALAMLFTSGSRGGLVGLGVLLVGGLFAAQLDRRKTFGIAAVAVAAALVFAIANPRTRAMFARTDPQASPNASNVQRRAMLDAGIAMGRERPVLGWGPGTTPLAFPKFRNQVNGGVEDVLQLHSLPLQIFAELGGLGLLALLTLVVLIGREILRRPPTWEAVTLAGYLVFSLTDYQVDLPIFAFVLAALAASLAPTGERATASRSLDLFLRFAVVSFAGFARPDPTPAMNLRALALAADPAKEGEAIELFDTSLALNPDQEIAHFNLGWLLVVRDSPAAERHFLAAARLVPDKGGVYFGLGLARLNQGHRDAAARAFATECLNDPVFLLSPWWKDPVVGGTRSATFAEVRRALLADHGARAQSAYLAALLPWLEGIQPASSELATLADTPERKAFFNHHPVPPPFSTAPVRFYRRERSGYPVLMRNLDLSVPVDRFDVQENALATGEFRFLFPEKGWYGNPPLPAP